MKRYNHQLTDYIKRFYFLVCLLPGSMILAQKAEQIAVDYYAEEFADENKNIRIRYDGKITNCDNKYAKDVILDFYDCKIQEDYRVFNSKSFEEWEFISQQLKDKKIEYEKFEGDIKIPKNFVARSKLKHSSIYRSSISYYLNKGWYYIFPEKYNFSLEPSVKNNGFYYVKLSIAKKDREYGNIFYIKLNEELKIVESCKSGWIQ